MPNNEYIILRHAQYDTMFVTLSLSKCLFHKSLVKLKMYMMKKIGIIIFLLITSFALMAKPPEVSKKFEKELAKHFESDLVKTIAIKELSKFSDLFFKVLIGDKELGIVVLTSAKGRFDMFDYMIVYNQKHEVELIKILVYRSDYGSEITAKRWLNQFYTKQTDSFKYGSDIQAISGATFSATSLTRNVNRINKIVKENSTK